MTWHNITNPPAEAKSVLLAVRGETEASEGFRIRDEWIYSDGHHADAAKAYAWAELPACPETPEVGLKHRPTLKPLRVRSVRRKGGRT